MRQGPGVDMVSMPRQTRGSLKYQTKTPK